MKQQGYQIFIALFALIGMCSACSEPHNEENIPEFHLELVDELFLKTAYGTHTDVAPDGVHGVVGAEGASLDMGVLGAHIGDLLGGKHPRGEIEAGQGGDALQDVGIAVLQLDIVEDHLLQGLHAPHPLQALHGVGGVHVAAEEDPLQGLGPLQGEGIIGDLFGGIQPEVFQLGIFRHIPKGAVADVPVDASRDG